MTCFRIFRAWSTIISTTIGKVGGVLQRRFPRPRRLRAPGRERSLRAASRAGSLAAILTEQNRATDAARRRSGISRRSPGRACAVVTGQQVGLFSGPLYTIYKALTAIKLAERAQPDRLREGSCRSSGWPRTITIWRRSINRPPGQGQPARRDPLPDAVRSKRKIPASNLVLPPEIADCLRRLGDLTPDSEFKAEILGRLSEAYRPGRSWVEAFARWMTRLFKSYGLIFIDASDPRLKEMGRDVFRREIGEDSPVDPAGPRRLRETARSRIRSPDPAARGDPEYLLCRRERRSIQWHDGAFEIKDAGERDLERRPPGPGEGEARLSSAPMSFSGRSIRTRSCPRSPMSAARRKSPISPR